MKDKKAAKLIIKRAKANPNLYTKEEIKMIYETKKILLKALPNIKYYGLSKKNLGFSRRW